MTNLVHETNEQTMIRIEKNIKRLINRYYSETPISVRYLGGGFYAKVFEVKLSREPFILAVKVYLTETVKGLVDREEEQLKLLKEHSLLKVPNIYLKHKADDEIQIDALIMEYIKGPSAGSNSNIKESRSDIIGNQIVDNLIKIHSVTNEKGFGGINVSSYAQDWREIYKEKANDIYNKAITMDALYEEVKTTMKIALDEFDKIFYLPITKSSLIHGDYNNWDLIVNENGTEVVAMIDPYNCGYADSEYDLFQLNNANGKELNLLNKYIERVGVSENFHVKNPFYELFSEVMHYYDSGVKPEDRLLGIAEELELQMKTLIKPNK